MERHSIDARINACAATQFGLVTAGQLTRLGIDRSSLARRVQAGTIRAVLPRVYAVGPAVSWLSSDGWRMAAVLSGGRGAALCRSTAAVRHQIWRREESGIHVVVPARRKHAPLHGIRFHETALATLEHVEIVGRIPTLSVTATCVSLMFEFTPWQLASVFHEAAFRGVLHLEGVIHLLDQHRRAPGSAGARRAIELHQSGSAGTRSWTEDRLLAGMLRRGFAEPIVNTRNSSPVVGFEPDFCWPDRRLVVEVDGGGHLRPGAPENDERVDNSLTEHGWRVLRLTAADVWRRLDPSLALVGVHLACA